MNRFEIEYLTDATEFIRSINQKASAKLLYNISKAQLVNDVEVFKKLKNTEIWEFRAKYEGLQYRLFAFWDKRNNTFVVCTHGIIKKTKKTPKKEIGKAEQIRKKYLEL